MAQEEKFTAHRMCMREVDVQIRSNRPFIYIVSHEEKRVLDALSIICERPNRKWSLLTWDIAEGLKARSAYDLPKATVMDQIKILTWYMNEPGRDEYTILVLKDFQKFYNGDDQVEKKVLRQFLNLCDDNIGKRKVIVITGTSLFLPPEIEKIAAVIDWPLPEPEHIAEKINQQINTVRNDVKLSKEFRTEYDNSEMDEIIHAFQGMTLSEITLLCTYTMLKENALVPSSIAKEKQKIVRKSGFLEWVEVKQGMSSIGGLHELKRWLSKRRNAFSTEAQEYGLPVNPKGVLLTGVSGSGKSLAAQAIADFWHLPLLRLDMGKVFGEYVGRSEGNVRSMIKVAEATAPVVLWIDELEKGLAGSTGSGRSDGGVTARVMGAMLTWMQEKQAPVYVVATANDVSILPAELLRKGRFDEVFFVDLPNESDRKEIFRIHLALCLRDPKNFDIDLLASVSDSFTGAEIKEAIISALYNTFDDNKRSLTTTDIVNSISTTVPLATTMSEKITALRKWASTRARNASGEPENIVLNPVQKTPKEHDNIASSSQDEPDL